MFQIIRKYLEHSGGTKFYQPFLFKHTYGSGQLQSAVSLMHYGPNSSAGSGAHGRPVLGGQMTMKSGEAYFYEQINAKRRRTAKGYYEITGEFELQNFGTPEEFGAELVRLFGASKRDEIMLGLGLTVDGADAAPIEHPETIDSEPEEKHAAWGSW